MRMPRATTCFLIALVLSGLAAAAPGFASKPLANEHEPGETISESQARDIAWSAGLVHVEGILRYGDRWEVAGRSVDDDEMLLDIDIRNGRILD